MAGHCKIKPAKSLTGAGLWIQNGPLLKITNFRGALDFLAPKWAKKILGSSKILDFVPGPFRIHKPAPLSDLAGFFFTDQDLSNETTFSQIKSRGPVPIIGTYLYLLLCIRFFSHSISSINMNRGGCGENYSPVCSVMTKLPTEHQQIS